MVEAFEIVLIGFFLAQMPEKVEVLASTAFIAYEAGRVKEAKGDRIGMTVQIAAEYLFGFIVGKAFVNANAQ